MKSAELFTKYKEYLIDNGKVLTHGSLLYLKTLINFSVKHNYNTIDQHLIEEWCDKRDSESVSSCNKRRSGIRDFLRFVNSNYHKKLELPPSLSVIPRSEFKSKKPMTKLPLEESVISNVLGQYIEYLHTIGPKICGTTHKNLIRFNNFLSKHYAHTKVLTNDMVSAWCDRRETESNDSRNTRVLPIRMFLIYATERGLVDVQVPSPLKSGKKYHRTPHIFSEDELQKFFASTTTMYFRTNEHRLECTLMRIQAPVYFRLLYSTGMRTNEARELRCKDVDLENGIISIVNTKGLNQHRVALHPSTHDLLRRYETAIEKLMPDRCVFFPTKDDHFHSIGWQASIFRKLWKQISSCDARAYDFRNTYAVENITSWNYEGPAWFDKLFYLSRSMGHTRIESTCYYYHLSSLFPKTLEEKTGDQLHSLLPDFSKFFDDEAEY